MPLPNPKPFTLMTIDGAISTVATGGTIALRAPFAGRVVQVGVTVGGTATATGPATVTTNINGAANPITGGVIVVPQATIDLTTAVLPTGLNTVNENDTIGFVFSGTGTAGGQVMCWADIRRGTL